jgi:UDP-N-acetylglucosamine diphosphorylase/glucosamine-1-phosphate N-acetyltransferase
MASRVAVRVVTEQQAVHIVPVEFGGQPVVLLTSLVPDLDEADLQRLCSEHSRRRLGKPAPQITVVRGAAPGSFDGAVALQPKQIVAGFVVDASQVADLFDEAIVVARCDANEPPAQLERVALKDLMAWSALKSNERRQRAEGLLRQHVRLDDWATLDVEGELRCAPGVRIGANVIVEGCVTLARGVEIGAYTYLRDTEIGAHTQIRPFSCLEDSVVGDNCRVGPYARLRADTVLANDVSIGNFVEIKTTTVGAGGRINHLAFLGDADLEQSVTIGAGVITCNHDGEKNVPTHIERGVYVGCGSQLVAPIRVGADATIGAGSTSTDDVEAGGLTLARSRQVRIETWVRKTTK